MLKIFFIMIICILHAFTTVIKAWKIINSKISNKQTTTTKIKAYIKA